MEKPIKRELPREMTEGLSPEEQVRLQQLTNSISELAKQQNAIEAVDFARVEISQSTPCLYRCRSA